MAMFIMIILRFVKEKIIFAMHRNTQPQFVNKIME